VKRAVEKHGWRRERKVYGMQDGKRVREGGKIGIELSDLM